MPACHLWTVMLAVTVVVRQVTVVVPVARGIWLNLPSNTVKCLSEDIRSNVLVMAEYYAFYGDHDVDLNGTSNPSLSIKVSSPHGNELHRDEKVFHGNFAFTTTESGSYQACFWVDGLQADKNVTVGLDWRTGIATKDWDSIAKKEKIEGLDLELRKLEDAVQYIHEKMMLRRDADPSDFHPYKYSFDICFHSMFSVVRELKMKELNNATNARVARYSLMSLGLCVLVSFLQVWYLRRYFRKKKLI